MYKVIQLYYTIIQRKGQIMSTLFIGYLDLR